MVESSGRKFTGAKIVESTAGNGAAEYWVMVLAVARGVAEWKIATKKSALGRDVKLTYLALHYKLNFRWLITTWVTL